MSATISTMLRLLAIFLVILAVVWWYPSTAVESAANPITNAPIVDANILPTVPVARKEIDSTLGDYATLVVELHLHGADEIFAGQELLIYQLLNKELIGHSVRFDQRKRAKIRFSKNSRVAYLSFNPPQTSTFSPQHLTLDRNLSIGETSRVELHIYTAGGVHGSIVDINKRGIPDVEVQLFSEFKHKYPQFDTKEPLHTTLSDSDGSFKFTQAPPGARVVLANPQHWLTVDPDYANIASNYPAPSLIQSGETLELGPQQVLPLELLQILVTDDYGIPFADCAVSIKAISLRNANIINSDQAPGLFNDSTAISAWLNEKPSAVDDTHLPFISSSFFTTSTSDAGLAQTPLLAGTYQITLRDYPQVTTEIELPSKVVNLRAPVAQRKIEFTIVDQDQKTLDTARIFFAVENREDSVIFSDENGKASYLADSRSSDIFMTVSHPQAITQAFDFATLDNIPKLIEVQSSTPLFGTISDKDGKDLSLYRSIYLRTPVTDNQNSHTAFINDASWIFSSIAPGVQVVQCVNASGWDKKIIGEFALDPSLSPHHLIIDTSSLPQANVTYYQIIDATSRTPLNNASITFRFEGGSIANSNSDAYGKIKSIQRVRPLAISVRQYGYLAIDVDLPINGHTTADDPFIIPIQRGGRLSKLSLIGSKGKSYRYGAAKVIDLNGNEMQLSDNGYWWSPYIVIENGIANLGHIAPGQYNINFYISWSFDVPSATGLITIPQGTSDYYGIAQMNKSVLEMAQAAILESAILQGYTDY